MRPRSRGAIAALCLIPLATASPAVARLRLGVEAGANLSTLRYDDELSVWDNGWRTSFTGGAVFEILQPGRFALVTGLRFVRQGNEVSYEYLTGPSSDRVIGEFRIFQDYLAVPVLMEFRPLHSRRLFVSLGPEIGILVSARLDDERAVISGGTRSESTVSRNIKSDLTPANVTLDVGMGFEFPMENHVGVAQVRYVHGVIDVADKDAWITNWKTQGVEVLTGIRW